jgi:TonB-linked SusC/RagA family outer membrane protein
MIGKPSYLKCLMAFFLLLNCTFLFAQERVVTGKIKDPSGNPLPGVNVNVFGTRISVTADVTGTFRIPVPSENSVLVFSFVGFLQKEQKVGSDSAFNILMTYDNADLDQVVVVGYGTSKRRDLTGAVYSIKPGMVTATPVMNVGEALQGRIPGLDINRTNGAPGGGVSIQLRGNRTLSGTANGQAGSSSEPLVIIDGFQGGSLTDLNPNDIESVEVLKDASSTAIYGWMGANGVIIITTKKGKDRPKVSYAGYYGVNGYLKYPKPRMGDQFIQFRKDAYLGGNPGAADPAPETLLDKNEKYFYALGDWIDWQKLVTQNGIEQSHTFSIQSGGDKTKVYFSTGIYNEQGILKGTDNTRYNARLNYDQRISNIFKAGFATQLTYTNTDSRTDPFSQISQMTPLGQPYDDSLGRIRLWPGLIPDANYADPGNKNALSPITDERYNGYKWNTARGNLIANAYVEATPLTGLSVRSNFGTNLTYSREGRFFDSVTLNNYSNQKNVGSSAEVINNFIRFYNWDNIVTYTHKFGDHAITLTGLTSYTRSDAETQDFTGYKLFNPSLKFYGLEGTNATNRSITSKYQRYNTFSYAGRLNYTLMGKYLLTATLRSDGVSRLSEGHKWDYFPSVGLGWNIHQEDFMKDLWFVNNLKLRATYGVAGNASVLPYGTQTVLASNNYIIGTQPVPVAYPTATPGNDNLGWEKSTTYNVGLDFALFKSRLYGTIDAYKTKTDDILYQRPLPSSSGEATQWQNIGTSENKGIELALSSVNVNNHAFKWTTTVTFTMAREKLTKLLTSKDIINAETNSLLIGHPVTSFYGYKKEGIWQTDENKDHVKVGGTTYEYQPGDIKVLDRNTDGFIDATNDRGYVGSTVPKWFGGLQNTFSYKSFELSVYMVARWGQTINAEMMAGRFNVNGSGNGLADWNYWTPTNPTNDFPQPRSNQSFSSSGYTGYLSALNFVDGSFVKLKTATLAYTIPGNISRKVYSDRIRLYVTGNNILTKTKYKLLKNYDPERGGSENTPLTRQFVFGANVDF